MDQICVLMASYNGEKFIRDQIDSILNQQGVEVRLIVRDDHSTDSTTEILREYEEAGKLTVLRDDVHLGAPNGFMKLLYTAEPCDYYAFADQDDLWLPGKLKRGIDYIRDLDVPALYCSNQIIYKNGEDQGLRFKKAPNYTLTNAICGNSLSGCTMVFNRALRDQLCDESHRPDPDLLNVRMHDVWVLLSALVLGRVVYDPGSGIRYRIHESNTVGIRPTGPAYRIKTLRKRLASKANQNGRSRIARELLKYDIPDPDKKAIVEAFANYRDSIGSKLRLATDKQIKKDCGEKRLVFLAKTFMNWV